MCVCVTRPLTWLIVQQPCDRDTSTGRESGSPITLLSTPTQVTGKLRNSVLNLQYIILWQKGMELMHHLNDICHGFLD